MRKLLLATMLLATGTFGAHAADPPLIVEEEVAVAPDYADASIYVQLLGGVALGLDSTFWSPSPTGVDWAMDPGYALAGTIGVVVMDGLSVEADVFHENRNFADVDDWSLATTSLMGNVKFTADIGDMFSIYGAAGLGYVWLNYNESGTDFQYSGFGYQLIAGVGVDVAENVEVIGEVRYQNTFDAAPWEDDDNYLVQAPILAVLGGVKVGF